MCPLVYHCRSSARKIKDPCDRSCHALLLYAESIRFLRVRIFVGVLCVWRVNLVECGDEFVDDFFESFGFGACEFVIVGVVIEFL